MALWDRVTGAVATELPADAPPGRYVADGAGDVLFGTTRAAPGDQLVAAADRAWSATLPTGHAAGRFAAAEIVDEVTQAALDAIAEQLLTAPDAIAWTSAREIAPFKRPRPEQLEPTRLDVALGTFGPHLLEVVRAPHLHLDAIVEPVLASRARRIPPRAIEHLAEHSEDWRRRTIRGIVPRRILSQHADEQLDVYENRLVARTIDRLLAYLRRREAELAACDEQLTAGDADDLGGPHWLARRLAALWGTTFASAEQRERLGRLQRQAEDRRRRIGGLMDSELYAAIPRRAAVRGELRRTNVLVNHQHYQRVVALWRVLEEEAPELAVRDPYAAGQRMLRSFDAFALLLVARSLDGLGYAPSSEESLTLRSAGELALEGPRGRLALAWDPLHGATLRRGDVELVRFVPLAARLAGSLLEGREADRLHVWRRVEALRAAGRAATATARHTVLLYPGRRSERAQLPVELGELLNPPDAGLGPAPSCAVLSVSPLDLYSAERVDRVTRRAVLIDLFERVPPLVACQRLVREEAPALAPWLAPDRSGEGLVLLASPDASQRARLRAGAQKRAGQLRPRQDDRLRRAWLALPDVVEEAVAVLDAVAICPICGARGDLRLWTDGTFKVACTCATWGMRPCGACEARIPFLAVHAEQRAERQLEDDAERLDRKLGRDLLAVPRPDAEDTFRCPTCGA